MVANDTNYTPPLGPPPLLSIDQIRHLAFQGWLSLDLPAALTQALDELSDNVANFFDKDDETKRSLYPAGRGTELGFYAVENEKEYITFRHYVHQDSHLEHLVAQVWQQAGLLLYRILCDLARIAQVPLTAWDHLIERSLDLPPSAVNLDYMVSLLRLFNYYPSGGFAAEHTDLGLLTLCVGGDRGLQVLDRRARPSQYIDAEGPTIVVGDTLRILLSDRVRAGMHRVVATTTGRSSTVFALRPYLEHPTDLSAFGGEGIIDTAELFRRVKGSKYNVNTTKDVRDRQQEAQRKGRK